MENVSVYIRLLACLVCGGGFSLAALLAISLARLSSLISQAEDLPGAENPGAEPERNWNPAHGLAAAGAGPGGQSPGKRTPAGV